MPYSMTASGCAMTLVFYETLCSYFLLISLLVLFLWQGHGNSEWWWLLVLFTLKFLFCSGIEPKLFNNKNKQWKTCTMLYRISSVGDLWSPIHEHLTTSVASSANTSASHPWSTHRLTPVCVDVCFFLRTYS